MKTQQEMLAIAISIASSGHKGQLDKGGKAYILHPLRIMMRLRTDDAELMQIAVLHDLLEDTNYTSEHLRGIGFSERVLEALEFLTHKKGVSYEYYIIKISKNKDATRIKVEDLRDNSDITRLKGVTERDLRRVEKYHKAFLFLEGL